jgi:hypothetical protein
VYKAIFSGISFYELAIVIDVDIPQDAKFESIDINDTILLITLLNVSYCRRRVLSIEGIKDEIH